MSLMLIGNSVVGQFEKKDLSLLLAYDISKKPSVHKILSQRLSKPATVWTVPISVPIIGDVFQVKPDKEGYTKIEDCTVKMVDGSPPAGNVRAMHHFGGNIYCEKTNDPPTAHPRSREVPLLFYSAGGITLLADVIDGPDCFRAVSIWTDDRLPLKYLLWRPELRQEGTSKQKICWKFTHDHEGSTNVSFAVICEKCQGNGELSCEKCSGIGIYKPRMDCSKCDGNGNFSQICKWCSGSGKVICKKCDGSGDHYSAKGNRYDCSACDGTGQWNCNGCGGTGRRDFECNSCEGRGYFPEQQCFDCEGKGNTECFVCRGDGYTSVAYDEFTHVFSRCRKDKNGESIIKEYFPHEVYVFDWMKGEVLETTGQESARYFLESFTKTENISRSEHERCEALSNEFSTAEECLKRYIKAEGGIIDPKPFRLGNRHASQKRKNGFIIYEFRVIGKSKWLEKKTFPFSKGTELALKPAPEIDVTVGNKNAIVIQLHDIDFETGQIALRFPIGLKIETLADDFEVRPKEYIKPSEETQIQNLRCWCDKKNLTNPILRAMVKEKKLAISMQSFQAAEFSFFNTNMLKFPSQCQAVQNSLSATPLVLLKGPPGTGKTTVIKEITQQAVRRGERVLITSQTHQAVDNVLERLAKEQHTEYRMVRHYSRRADLSGLADWERRYAEIEGIGGMDDYFQQLDDRGEFFRNRYEALQCAITNVQKASEAASQLVNLRTNYTAEKESIDQNSSREKADADTIARSKIQNAEIRWKAIQKNYKKDNARQSYEKLSLEKNLALLKNHSRLLKTRLEKYRQQQIPKSSDRSWFMQTIDCFLPDIVHDYFKNATVLLERYEKLTDEIRKSDVEIAEKITLLTKIENVFESEKQRWTVCLNDAEAEQQQTHEASEKKRQKCQQEILEIFQNDESAYLLLQEKAVLAGRNVGWELMVDSPEKTWNKVINSMMKVLEEHQKRMELFLSWYRDALAEIPTLTQFFEDRTQVYFSTCVGLAGWRRVREYGHRFFDLVIVDEAAHATMPETLVPILYAKRVVLVGDEKQLPPVVAVNLDCREKIRTISHENSLCVLNIKDLQNCWLEQSLFARLWDSKIDIPRTMLDIQFRMHPVIGDFVSKTFYSGLLKNGTTAGDRQLSFESFVKPVCLVPTLAYRQDRHEKNAGTSYCNPCEAKLVAKILETADRELAAMRAEKGDKWEFGIVTPYAAQVAEIKNELKKIPKFNSIKFSEEDIASVDKYQGSEKDVIIISFVRSPKSCEKCDRGINRDTKVHCESCNGTGLKNPGKQLGFVRELRRLNVAFSRPRRQLILVGDIEALHNPNFLGNEEGRQVFEDFYQYVTDQGYVLPVWEGGV